MSDAKNRPDLTLGEPPGRLRRADGGVSRTWLGLILVLQAAIAIMLGWNLARRGDPVGGSPSESAATPASAQRELAHELENRSLYAQAAYAWEEYLRAAPQAGDRAEVWFRVGRLFMQAEQFEQAAAALLRCEQAGQNDPAWGRKVGPELVTCLRRLGLSGEVGRELSRRVEAGAGDVQRGRVLATLAGEPLTEADLDRMIEQRIDQMLAMPGAEGTEGARQRLLDEFAQPETRRRLFEQLLQTELFTRRARELGLDRDPQYIAARRAVADDLLAARFQARELAKIQPTDVDLEAFYKLDADRYREPETAHVRIGALQPDEQPATVLEGIHSADDFRRWLQSRPDAKDKGKEGKEEPSIALVRGRPAPRLGNVDALFALDVGAWTKEPIEHDGQRFLVLIEDKSPPRTPPLAEIRERVREDYVARKRAELSQRLADDLMQRYQVKLERWDADKQAGGADGNEQ